MAFTPQQLARAATEPIRTDARSCTILPSFVGKKFMVHNGKSYIPVTVAEEMVGRKLGEFAATKKPAIFKVGRVWCGRVVLSRFLPNSGRKEMMNDIDTVLICYKYT